MSAHWRDYTDQLTPEQVTLIEEHEQKLAASMAASLVATAEMAIAVNGMSDEEFDRLQRHFPPSPPRATA